MKVVNDKKSINVLIKKGHLFLHIIIIINIIIYNYNGNENKLMRWT